MERNPRILLVLVAGFLCLLGATSAQGPVKGASGKKTERSAQRSRAVVRPASEIRWKDVPDIEGVKRSVIWGNPEKTAYGALEKMPASASLTSHWHSYDVSVVMLSGTLVITLEGKPPQELGPGSYYFLPGGLKHTQACKGGEDCVVFVMQSGLDDTKWVGQK
jgi:quercetin dioxygenase-like cupin family protein